ENCHADQLGERLSKIVLVVFNYDRCIEHFLFHAIQNYYKISADKAALALKSLAIFHPYGSVGTLPWQGGSDSIAYGSEPNWVQLFDLSQSIKTFTEGTDEDSSDIKDIRASVESALLMVFLGFAFHRLNLALLKPKAPHTSPYAVKYYGTAFGISRGDCEFIKGSLQNLAGASDTNITLEHDQKCAPFFIEHWHRLSLG
ncbi:MAG: hypothetical protein ABI645_12620, partial [Pseudomonadota bacterium]